MIAKNEAKKKPSYSEQKPLFTVNSSVKLQKQIELIFIVEKNERITADVVQFCLQNLNKGINSKC